MVPVLVEVSAGAADVLTHLCSPDGHPVPAQRPRCSGRSGCCISASGWPRVPPRSGGLLGGRPLAPLVLRRGLARPRPDQTKLCSSLRGLSLPPNSVSAPGTEPDSGNGGRTDDE